jgi:hypothetical protein
MLRDTMVCEDDLVKQALIVIVQPAFRRVVVARLKRDINAL